MIYDFLPKVSKNDRPELFSKSKAVVQRHFVNKPVLENFVNFRENSLCQNLFFFTEGVS